MLLTSLSFLTNKRTHKRIFHSRIGEAIIEHRCGSWVRGRTRHRLPHVVMQLLIAIRTLLPTAHQWLIVCLPTTMLPFPSPPLHRVIWVGEQVPTARSL